MTWYISALPQLLVSGPVVLLIRHAERGPITDPTMGHDVPLTDRGREAAEATGRAVGAAAQGLGRVVVAHSPVPRCEETARRIARGAETSGANTSALGARGHLGGPYLLHTKEALELMRDHGAHFMRRWFEGALPTDLLSPTTAAANHQVDAALHVAQPDAAVTVLVTHDLNVMLVRETLFGVRHEDLGWVDFLDGVALVHRPRTARYRGWTVDLRGPTG